VFGIFVKNIVISAACQSKRQPYSERLALPSPMPINPRREFPSRPNFAGSHPGNRSRSLNRSLSPASNQEKD